MHPAHEFFVFFFDHDEAFLCGLGTCATAIDGVAAAEYATNPEANLSDLLETFIAATRVSPYPWPL